MGHQSYVVIYESEEQKEAIVAAVNAHNAETNSDIRGETLTHICDARYYEGQKVGTYYEGDVKIVMFSNGGGRNATFMYLDDLLEKDGLETVSFEFWYSAHGQPDEVPSFIDVTGVWKENHNNTAQRRAEAAVIKHRELKSGEWGPGAL